MILCQDETTNGYVHEARYLRDMMAAYARGMRDFDSFTCHYFQDRQGFSHFHRDTVAGFLEAVRRKHGGPENLVLKEPQLTILFPFLNELVPEARFVCSVRDPLDAIASLVTVGEKEQLEGVRTVLAKRDMVRLSNIFKAYYAPLLNSRNRSLLQSTIFVRYEDTVLNTDAVVQHLREFTGLKLDAVAPERGIEPGNVDFSNVSKEQSRWLTGLFGKPVSSGSVGKHRDVLTRTEIETVRSECSDFIEVFRMEPVCTGAY
jgi:hypothetical protein